MQIPEPHPRPEFEPMDEVCFLVIQLIFMGIEKFEAHHAVLFCEHYQASIPVNLEREPESINHSCPWST